MIVALARSLKNRFPAAKALGAAVLCCLALAACDSEPLFDASSVPAYQKSLDAINARLNLQDRNQLKIALVTLAAGGAAEFTQAGLPRVPANIAAFESVANPTPLLDRMRPTIEGKTAAAVIAIVVADIDAEIARAEGHLGETDADETLSKIVIENELYDCWTGRPDCPRFKFSIYNGRAKEISRVYLSGVLASRGRATPWATGALFHSFNPALQSGTQQQAIIFITSGRRVGRHRAQARIRRNLTLKVTNANDTAGRKLRVSKQCEWSAWCYVAVEAPSQRCGNRYMVKTPSVR